MHNKRDQDANISNRSTCSMMVAINQSGPKSLHVINAAQRMALSTTATQTRTRCSRSPAPNMLTGYHKLSPRANETRKISQHC
jgi:hypothetical protein